MEGSNATKIQLRNRNGSVLPYLSNLINGRLITLNQFRASHFREAAEQAVRAGVRMEARRAETR